MLFSTVKLAGNEQMDRKRRGGGWSAKFIDIYPRSQVSIYRTIGPLV